MEERVIMETNLPELSLFSRGKVRDTWLLPKAKLLVVATDRVSAFDVGMPDPIPGKGKTLNKMSAFWFELLKDMVDVRTHFIGCDLSLANSHHVWTQAVENDLEGRSMIVKKADSVIPIEAVVRGYLAGSGWDDYQKSGEVCGIKLPPGLLEGSKLPEPTFTPTTKETRPGEHDRNIEFPEMEEILADWLKEEDIKTNMTAVTLAYFLRRKSLTIYRQALHYASKRGIIIADTKLEWGWLDDGPILVDELLTPDSSRFWPVEGYEPGKSQPSFDKQYLRDYLKSTDWNKQPPAPELPEEVVQRTKERYLEAQKRLIS